MKTSTENMAFFDLLIQKSHFNCLHAHNLKLLVHIIFYCQTDYLKWRDCFEFLYWFLTWLKLWFNSRLWIPSKDNFIKWRIMWRWNRRRSIPKSSNKQSSSSRIGHESVLFEEKTFVNHTILEKVLKSKECSNMQKIDHLKFMLGNGFDPGQMMT